MVREIPLNGTRFPGLVALIDDEDFARVSAHRWHAERDGETYYVRGRLRGDHTRRVVKLHQFVLGFPECELIDHADRDGLNCQKGNLRPADRTLNHGNSKLHRNNTSERRGVTREKCGRWRARIRYRRQEYHLGIFGSKEEAATAYDTKARELYGEFAPTSRAEVDA